MRNRFKGLDLIECLKNYGWRYRRQWSRSSLRIRKAKRQNGCLRRSYKQGGYSSVLFSKQRKIHPGGVRADQPQRRGLSTSWLPPFICLSPSRWVCPMQIGSARKWVGLFPLKFLLGSLGFLLFHFCRLFPSFVFQTPPFWTPFSYSNYLKRTIKR